MDAIHTYAIQSNVVEYSSVGLDDFGSQPALVDQVGPSRSIPHLDSFTTFFIGLTLHVTGDDSFRVNNLKASTSLSLIHPILIDWLIQHQRPKIPSFQNYYEIACYLNAIEPVTSSTSEPMVNMTESNIKYLSHKIKRKNKWSDGENHFVAVSKPKESKNKDVSIGENLLEAPTDEVLGSMQSYF